MVLEPQGFEESEREIPTLRQLNIVEKRKRKQKRKVRFSTITRSIKNNVD